MLILLQLLLAHILTDFVLQPTWMVKHKRRNRGRSVYLYIHSLLAGVLTVVLLFDIRFWYVGLFVSITHFLIDLWKLHQGKDSLKYFLIDQFLHLVILLIAWLHLTNNFQNLIPEIGAVFLNETALAIIIGYLLIIFPTGFLIGKATQRWQSEVEDDLKRSSLEAAGRYIGIFERILVLTFILTNNFSAIGFLIAAKSILRFSDKSESGARKQTEYVLIGTLMSFAITIIVGFLVRHIAF